MTELEIVSGNMGLACGDASRRYYDFHEAIISRKKKPDLITLQEVAWHPGEAALRALALELGGEYTMETCSVYPEHEDEKGLVIISKHPVVTHRKVDFSTGGKAAQVATVELSDTQTLQLVNLHMESSPLKEVVRIKKVKELLALMSQTPDIAQLVAGDFNAETFFPCVRLIKRLGMSSVFDSLEMKSPPTYPTELNSERLIGHGYSKPHQFHIMKVLGQCTRGPICDVSGMRKSVVDYILHNRHVVATAAEVFPEKFVDEPFSDHKLLGASFVVPAKAEIKDDDMANYDELPELDTTALPESNGQVDEEILAEKATKVG